MRALVTGLIVAALCHAVPGQGEFINFESPQVRPITTATVNGKDWLLVCNTPDNAVEIYDASSPYDFVQRVPVGLEPVTVRWNAGLGHFFTCNFVGDSVTSVRLDPSGDRVHATVLATSFVGDEPCDLAFTADDQTAFVSLNSRSSFSQISTADLSVGAFQVPLLVQDVVDFAVKQPRAAAGLPDGRILFANFMGGRLTDAARFYDFDLYLFDPFASPTPTRITDLGTTHHSMAVQQDGTRMFVVGTKAQHLENVGVEQTSQSKTGFVQSWLWVVDIPAGQTPTVVPEAPAGNLPSPTFQSINLNRDYSSASLEEVRRGKALAQPTDVALLEDGNGVQKVILTAYHSDRVAILTPDANADGGWQIGRVRLHRARGDYGMVGPRGLAVSDTATDPNAGAPGLIYTMNRLDQTVSVIDPQAETELTHFSLQSDPTPSVIRHGRQFLYGAKFSGNGMVSCASCHVDGRTDGLPWNLGNLEANQPTIDPWLMDGNDQSLTSFPTDKGPMVTQTLQGLVDSQVNGPMQHLFSNAPYHWRADKASVNEFNEAFVNLQGMPNDHGTPTDPKGLSDTDMQAYVDFVNTIVHPPNPEQPLDRKLTGTLDPSDPNNPDPALASGDKLGLLLYHNQPSVSTITAGVRSCVQCHNLPDGSSNTLSLAFPVNGTLQASTQIHPVESAAIRNVFQREMILHPDFTETVTGFTGNHGLLHPGDFGFLTSFSINTFVTGTFGVVMPGPTQVERDAQIQALVGFTRRFDSGIAPASGFAYTVDPGDPALTDIVFDTGEDQVSEANIGIVVYARGDRNGDPIEWGFWYDVTHNPPMYRQAHTTRLLTRDDLIDFADTPGHVVIFQGTPVGSERRIARSIGFHGGPAGGPVGIGIEPGPPPRNWRCNRWCRPLTGST